MTDKPKPCRITISAYRTHAEGGTQIQIAQLDATGTGWGRRLAGPKHYNAGTTTLVERDLDADDAREIRAMLDAAFPQPDRTAEVRAAAFREAADAIDPGEQECPPGCVNDCAGCTALADARMLRGLAARVLAAAPATEDGAR